MIKSTITSIMDQTNILISSPDHKDSPKAMYPTTVVPANRRAQPSDSGQSTKNGGMCTLKHEISSPKFYEIIINTELKVDTALDLNNLYNYTNMCINALNRI